MPRKPIEEKLAEAVEQLESPFRVTEAMRMVKAAFWAKAVDSPLVSPSGPLTLPSVQRLVDAPQLERWWSLPGFPEWFANSDEVRQRLEWAVNLGIDAVVEILADPGAPPMAKIRAFEIVSRLTGKEPAKKSEVKYTDDHIQRMNSAQLRAYLAREGVHIGASDGDTQTDDSADSGDSVQGDIQGESNGS